MDFQNKKNTGGMIKPLSVFVQGNIKFQVNE